MKKFSWEGGRVMENKIVWKPLKSLSPDEVEKWLMEMEFEPYLHDPVLQSIDWIKNLTRAIKKVEPLVGEGNVLEYLFWEDLQTWQFVLNSLSIARATGDFIISLRNFGWKTALLRLKGWVDWNASNPRMRDLFYGSTSFFPDMVFFFNSHRKLPNPNKLSKEVLEAK